MINEVRGLDYFLLPSLFSDCLAPGDIDALLRERDEWFSRNPKFGPAYVEGLKKMQQAGVDLLPSLDAGSEPDEHLPEVISTKLGAGRRANAEDQLARAGGLPRVSMAELTAMIPAGGQQVSQLLSVVNDVKPPLAFPTVKWYQYSIEEHDTDEEDDVGRKRRRRLAPVPVQVKVETKTKDTVTIESPKHEREGWTTTILDGFREVKVELNDVKLEDVKPIISRGMYRRPRFAVDKEHLRTLSRVSQDVDDL